jgi:hypothetical protein
MMKNKLVAIAIASLMIASSIAMTSAALPDRQDPTGLSNFTLLAAINPYNELHSNFVLTFYKGQDSVSSHVLSLSGKNGNTLTWNCYFNNPAYTDDNDNVITVPEGATFYELYNQQTKISTGKLPIDQKTEIEFVDINQGSTNRFFKDQDGNVINYNVLRIEPRGLRDIPADDNSHEWHQGKFGAYYDIVA